MLGNICSIYKRALTSHKVCVWISCPACTSCMHVMRTHVMHMQIMRVHIKCMCIMHKHYLGATYWCSLCSNQISRPFSVHTLRTLCVISEHILL